MFFEDCTKTARKDNDNHDVLYTAYSLSESTENTENKIATNFEYKYEVKI